MESIDQSKILCWFSITERNSLYRDAWNGSAGRAPIGHAYEDEEATFVGSWGSLQWWNSTALWQILLVFFSFSSFMLIRVIYATKMIKSDNKTFHQLSFVNQCNWINRVTSSIHAVLTIIGASYVILIDDCKRQLWNNPVFGSTIVSEIVACISMGYFLYDITDMLLHPIPGILGFIVHHVCVLGAYWCSTVFHRGGIWVMFSLLMEITTPFLNIRWFMAKYHLKSSVWYFYNGLMLTLGFLFFRIILHLVMFWHVWVHFEECTKVAKFVLISFLMQMMGVFTLNTYWFSLLLLGAWRILSKQKDPEHLKELKNSAKIRVYKKGDAKEQ